ncbi:hypothetical protein M413DRAFT_447242 [Hebeloma cylindrosporum]|uniref:Casein kinase II subunit beta n=1 Tax=Hebeloma cylindrosporum TaxID=76867 RepID=A0A0C3C6T1_HEBCY|nr:hypothetical protein M413DRAFT_447242 [Hebeloma cylindrosporum h7]
MQDELRGSLDVQARLLYGLIHARWIVRARGLTKRRIPWGIVGQGGSLEEARRGRGPSTNQVLPAGDW